MGYYTDFKLDCAVPENITIPDGLSYGEGTINEFLSRGELYDMKWYEHINDMLKVSLANPDIEFHTSGIGEEQGDQWGCLFLNGKYKKVVAKITFENFNDVGWK